MLLVAIIHYTYGFIVVSVINNKFFVAATNQTYMSLHSEVMEMEAGYVLGSRMSECLYEFVKAFLLESSHIILDLGLIW